MSKKANEAVQYCTHTNMHAHTRMHARACIHTHTHAHTRTHTHTYNCFMAVLDFVREYPGELVPER